MTRRSPARPELWEDVFSTRELGAGAQTCRAERRCRGHQRDEHEGAGAMAQAALAAGSGHPRCGHPPTAACPADDDPQGGGWAAAARTAGSALPGGRGHGRWRLAGERGGDSAGSPFSPLLANIVLDDVDRELERRGQRFVRYADDLRVYVRSERARQRVMASITQFVEQRLKLRVNRRKSAVAPATTRPMLGFGFCRRDGTVKIGVSPQGPPPGQGWLRRRLRQVRWKDGSAPRPGGATSARSAPTSVALARGPPIPGS
jgi:hypothetical protein